MVFKIINMVSLSIVSSVFTSALYAAEAQSIDTELGEVQYPNEETISKDIANEIEKTLRAQYKPGRIRRDAHPKAHGCVRADFNINEDIPDSLAKGMFVPGKSYPAWIRFSNGSQNPNRADIRGDARGMAIKILEVQGDKLVKADHIKQECSYANRTRVEKKSSDYQPLRAKTDAPWQANKVQFCEGYSNAQDFILVNHPTFFISDPQDYLTFIKKTQGGLWDKATIPFTLGFQGSMNAFETSRKTISNPTQARYWSMVPYQLGSEESKQAVKYSVKPCSDQVDPLPKDPEPNFLRAALKNTLDNQDVCMEFMIQPKTIEEQSVEDVTQEWKEEQAPFYSVAKIHIPQQTFDTREQNILCEKFSFNPWHSTAEHKPLGVVNRLRKGIYEQISKVRNERATKENSN
ncbi:MAG: catalase family protein [Pseudomonadota bacterium]